MKKILQMLRNNILYFINKGNGSFFENLAASNLLPEQVDGYVVRYSEPIVKEFFELTSTDICSLIKPGDKILDIGCGTGRYIKKLQEVISNIDIYGVDISNNTIENYTKQINDANLSVADFCIENPYKKDDIEFDFIYAITMLEYIPFFKLEDFVRNVTSALKSNGTLYIQFPHGQSKFDLYANFNYTRYPRKTVENVIIKNGLCIVKSYLLNPEQEEDMGACIIAKKYKAAFTKVR